MKTEDNTNNAAKTSNIEIEALKIQISDIYHVASVAIASSLFV